MITPEQIAEWRALQGRGMCSAIGEYTPSEFWDLLSAYEGVVRRLKCAGWTAVADRHPPHEEPVVYARPNQRRPGCWSVGIAYWTVSQKWNPEAESQQAPAGFTHWKPLGDPPA